MVICVAAIGLRGLNLGIDFRGGSEVAFSTPKPVSISDVRDEAATIGQANAVVQGRAPRPATRASGASRSVPRR